MSEEKFTKGPWKACEVSSGEWTVKCKGDYDCRSSDINEFSPTVCDMWNVTYAADLNKSQKANAHLIAASPKMYKLLSEIKQVIDNGHELGEMVSRIQDFDEEIDSLLKEARGEQC